MGRLDDEPDVVAHHADAAIAWTKIHNQWSDCTDCTIGRKAHCHVLGAGHTQATMLVVGEAPGRSEDSLGEPFIGVSGQLLRRALESAGLEEQDVFITNVLACRPFDDQGKDRKPSSVEMRKCLPRVLSIVNMLHTHGNLESVLLVGNTARRQLRDVLLDNYVELGELRLLHVQHPAFLLRSGVKPTAREEGAQRRWREYVASIRKLHEGK